MSTLKVHKPGARVSLDGVPAVVTCVLIEGNDLVSYHLAYLDSNKLVREQAVPEYLLTGVDGDKRQIGFKT